MKTQPIPPELTLEARRAALAKAALMRKERAVIREQLGKRETTVADLLKQMDNDSIGKMRVLSIVEALPGLGKVRSRRLMRELGISEKRRLRGLSKGQTERLLNAVTKKAA